MARQAGWLSQQGFPRPPVEEILLTGASDDGRCPQAVDAPKSVPAGFSNEIRAVGVNDDIPRRGDAGDHHAAGTAVKSDRKNDVVPGVAHQEVVAVETHPLRRVKRVKDSLHPPLAIADEDAVMAGVSHRQPAPGRISGDLAGEAER